MHDQPGGLVEHQQRLIFVDDAQLTVVRGQLAQAFRARREGDGDLVAADQRPRRAYALVVDEDGTVRDEPSGLGS